MRLATYLLPDLPSSQDFANAGAKITTGALDEETVRSIMGASEFQHMLDAASYRLSDCGVSMTPDVADSVFAIAMGAVLLGIMAERERVLNA